MQAHVPKVMKGTHPIAKEKARVERRALAKRLKGQRPDDAADRLKQAEAGKAKRKKKT